MHSNIIERILNKVPYTTSATRHLVPRLHCILDACQRSAHTVNRVGLSYA